jgi:hypothetical protein
VNKPVLKQIFMALRGDEDGREDVARQGTWQEDFLWNAVTMSASASYGRSVTTKNGQISDALTTKPSYSVSATYQLDLERLYVHTFHADSRPVDAGYYYEYNPQNRFWPEPSSYNNDRPN